MNGRALRLVFLAFLAVYGVAALRSPEEGRLIDGVDLAIHETGHLVFAPFGEVMGFLGGTLLQLIVPLVFVASFLRRGDRYAAAVTTWWVAQNCWNISVYVADARTEALPLVGGGEHDWAYLLATAGWLEHDQRLAAAIHTTGVIIFVLALAAGLLAVWHTPDRGAAEEAEMVAGAR